MKDIISNLQNLFFKEDFDPYLYVETEVDLNLLYYSGSWVCSPLFVSDLCNYKFVEKSHNPISMIKILKQLGFIGANINKFSPGAIISPHSDSDLVPIPNIITRIFIPLEPNYHFEFGGTILENKSVKSIESKSFFNTEIIFKPDESHSFKNTMSIDQYFLIGDIANTKMLTEDFWNHYLMFCLKHYV